MAEAQALARRWPVDWFTRYDRPVARIIPRAGDAQVSRAIVAAGTDAQPYPVRWPLLIGEPLPPIAGPTSVMGAPAAQRQ